MDDLQTIAGILRNGGTILYPTDTLWGIGCDACNAEAVQKVFRLKRRSVSKSVIILVADIAMLEQYVGALPPQVRTLLAAHEEPLTIIYPSAQGLAAGVCAQDGSVAARIAKHKFCTAITAALGCPIVSTSANISGNTAPTCLSCVDDDIKIRVDLIVDEQWEGCPTRRPSSIVQICEDGSIRKVR